MQHMSKIWIKLLKNTKKKVKPNCQNKIRTNLISIMEDISTINRFGRTCHQLIKRVDSSLPNRPRSVQQLPSILAPSTKWSPPSTKKPYLSKVLDGHISFTMKAVRYYKLQLLVIKRCLSKASTFFLLLMFGSMPTTSTTSTIEEAIWTKYGKLSIGIWLIGDMRKLLVLTTMNCDKRKNRTKN